MDHSTYKYNTPNPATQRNGVTNTKGPGQRGINSSMWDV